MPALDNSRETILKIAAAQKLLLWTLLFSILVFIGISAVSMALRETPMDETTSLAINGGIIAARIAAIVLQIYAVVQLCRALRKGYGTIFYVLSQLIPCVSLLLLVLLNGRVTKRLQTCGIRVGLMGANARDLAKYQPASSQDCPGCGEPIAADVTICPMCGTAVSGAS